MTTLILKLLLAAYIMYAAFEFFGFLFQKGDPEMRKLKGVFEDGGVRRIHKFDGIVLLMVGVMVALLVATGVEYLSFTTGLLVGMTILMTYTHRFSDPLPPEQQPQAPLTALKLMTYSIHAAPKKAWRELVVMAVLFAWALYMMVG